MVTKQTEILAEKSFIEVAPHSKMVALGYDTTDPALLECAGKLFQVKDVKWADEDLRHVYVYGSERCFIDADIARTWVNPFVDAIKSIREQIDSDEGSEFEIHIELRTEVEDSIDPRTGALNTHEVEEDAKGVLGIEKENDTWSWATVLHTDFLDVSRKESGFSSLEECLSSFADYIIMFDDFEVVQKY